jgi:hypothetical protein
MNIDEIRTTVEKILIRRLEAAGLQGQRVYDISIIITNDIMDRYNLTRKETTPHADVSSL